MGYCRYCGKEINFTRTANNKWMPYDVTGQPHFCQNDKNKVNTGLQVCKTCGKPIFENKKKLFDYSTLQEHNCKKIDITNYQKYLKKQEALKNANNNRKA